MPLLTSVWHTGTTYFKEGLLKHYGPMEFAHTHAEGILERARDADILYVTHRDYLRTAASWCNRGRPFSRWIPQWENYWKILELNPKVLDFNTGAVQHGIKFGNMPLNQHHDAEGLHKALDDGDLDYFWSKMPEQVAYLWADTEQNHVIRGNA